MGARAEIKKAILATLILAISLSPNIVARLAYAAQPDCQKCVAFRLDDIQDYAYSSEQRALIEMFLNNNASLTIGVIGSDFGQDEVLLDFIRQYKNDSRIEVANHGWLHEDFGAITNTASQQELLERTNLRIRDTLGQDVVITTFIAPFNSINEQTYEAVGNSGLYIISADKYDAIFANNRTAVSSLYHLPMTVEASIYLANNSSWHPVSADKILDKIHNAIEKDGNAVVMLHPWDSVHTMQSVIRHIQGVTDFKIVTLREMAFGENEVPEGLNAAILVVSLGGSFIAIRLFTNKRSHSS